ncbi:DUF1501 domain-containing protein [Fimbriiglobus ruber]|uniref:DUF1501 domain-containing protein n=1 Tax=Fimbriiglobus ruber TaxID=1908690 RepID=A0A225DG88_9BACT|nr:DUF1501 domain-containing protein [Fimbriiglobus ruber]OWK40550.1 hypothetical protein FRUB_05469 [Fimbriiglobus ruber]
MRTPLSRRDALKLGAAGLSSGWLSALAASAADHPDRTRSCIVLWMAGGPTQTDTFDPKPGHANGGPFKAIDTAAAGVKIGEHLPLVAGQMKHLAVVRSMATKEGDHGRASLHLRTGNLPQGAIDFPVFGSLIAKEREQPGNDLPGYVSITPRGLGTAALSAGFLGSQYAPMVVGGDSAGGDGPGGLRVENLGLPTNVSQRRADERRELLDELEADFLAARPGAATNSHTSAYQRAARLMRESAAKAFDLSDENDKLRDRYGRNRFGQGCLLARRLVERGVPFVEVTLGGWDTHDNNFGQVKSLCQTLDPAWATLMADLKDRGLLDTTTVVWMGEFGRTPGINPRQGRDHYPNAWSVVLGGGGIVGGQSVGKTGKDGMAVEDRPVAVPDLLATVCLALGIDPRKQNLSNVNRPIRIADQSAKPIKEVLA